MPSDLPEDSEAPSSRWFQIEVILFANRNLQTEEIWRDDLILSYPDNWVILKDPNNPEAAIPAAEQGPALAQGNPPASVESDHSTLAATAPKPVNLTTDAFYMLPKEERLLSKQAQELAWSKSYNLLYHEAWRQPVESQDLAPSVLIAAGEAYGDHHQIEGSLSVSVSRYLHVRSNLWIADFVPNDNQQLEFSPLPARPKPPALPPQSPNSVASTEEPEVTVINATERLNPSASPDTDEVAETFHTDSIATIETPPAYLPQNIAVLKQKRRMRSGEIHYIDHPRLGMLILVTPYDPSAGAGTNEPVQ
ncbi:hypothetical protein G8770_21100 [Aestuariicella hydrocarbonica]|uniref:Uncharacterized protein n=1 Tax=Pseudomaricurvus hydrocarbonicus TaxID=1470433 RepID=A0A9E5MPF6_9GAMM|nr:CsiV family protein [Aestuariicella hydrocarbonica]NHO68053.1 hypothetical protein [Aestuariicella hydrocarbonica]